MKQITLEITCRICDFVNTKLLNRTDSILFVGVSFLGQVSSSQFFFPGDHLKCQFDAWSCIDSISYKVSCQERHLLIDFYHI